MIEIVYILCLRQLKHYWRSKARLIGSLGQPLLFMIAFGFGFGPMYARASGGAHYIDFLAPGIITMAILFTAVFSGLEIIWDRQFGFLKETLVAPISRTEIMIGKTFGGAIIAMIQGLIMLSMTYLFGFRIPTLGSLWMGLIFMYPDSHILFRPWPYNGLKNGRYARFPNDIELPDYAHLFPIRSSLPLENLPPAINLISRIDPLTYGVDGLRGSFGGISNFGIYNDLVAIGSLSVLICAIGTAFFLKIEA